MRLQPQARDLAADREGLRVVLALHGEHCVSGQGKTARLQVLLQARLGILEGVRVRQLRDARGEQARHHRLHRRQALVEEDRPAQRLQGIRQDRLAAEAAGLEFPRPQLQGVPEPDRQGDLGQRLGADELRAQAAQVPLVRLWVGGIQGLGDGEVDDRIAQELEPFVVGAGGAAVGECGAEQGEVACLVAAALAASARASPRRSCAPRAGGAAPGVRSPSQDHPF